MDRLRILRESIGYTQKELADALGVDRTAIGKYETGASGAKGEMLIKIASFFHVSTDYLLDLTDEMNPAPMMESGTKERLSESEQEMLSLFRSLNDEGQLSALAMLRGLAASPAYIKSPVPRQVQEEIG